jgi:hypothetical protein
MDQPIIFPSGLTIAAGKKLESDVLIAQRDFQVATGISSINVDAKSVSSITSSTVELKTRSLSAGKNGKSVRVEGTLHVAGSVAYTTPTINLATSPFAASFVETSEKMEIHLPWRRVSLDTFDHDLENWSIKNRHNKNNNNDNNDDFVVAEGKEKATGATTSSGRSHCGDRNMFLGGHCQAGGSHILHKMFDLSRSSVLSSPLADEEDVSSSTTSSDTTTTPPLTLSSYQHDELRIVARVHMIDSWENELAWMSVDGNVVWTTTGTGGSLSTCGDEKHGEASMGMMIDVVVPHKIGTVDVKFGTSLNQHECDESLGVDDVAVYIH